MVWEGLALESTKAAKWMQCHNFPGSHTLFANAARICLRTFSSILWANVSESFANRFCILSTFNARRVLLISIWKNYIAIVGGLWNEICTARGFQKTIGQSILKLFMRLVAKFWARNALTLLDSMFRQIKKLTNKLGKLNLNQWVRLAS